MLKEYDREVHPADENLPEDVRVYRVRVVKCFLKAGVPLNKIDCFRDLLEENSLSLSSTSHLSQLTHAVIFTKIIFMRGGEGLGTRLTQDDVGENFNTPVLYQFAKFWIGKLVFP